MKKRMTKISGLIIALGFAVLKKIGQSTCKIAEFAQKGLSHFKRTEIPSWEYFLFLFSSVNSANKCNLNNIKLKFQQTAAHFPHPGQLCWRLCSGLYRMVVTITIIKLPLYNNLRELPAPIYLKCLTNHCLSLAFNGDTARVTYPSPGGHSLVVLKGGLRMK